MRGRYLLRSECGRRASFILGISRGWGCGLGHLVKAGEGGADLPDGRDGMDLMWVESGRSVEREREAGRSRAGRWSADLDLAWYSCLSMDPWFLQTSRREGHCTCSVGPGNLWRVCGGFVEGQGQGARTQLEPS